MLKIKLSESLHCLPFEDEFLPQSVYLENRD